MLIKNISKRVQLFFEIDESNNFNFRHLLILDKYSVSFLLGSLLIRVKLINFSQIITEALSINYFIKSDLGLDQFDHINLLIALSVITINSLHCNCCKNLSK
jgi:hypothetical protein